MAEHRMNGNYTILQSIPVGHTEYVLGERLGAVQPYVTWEYTNNDYIIGKYYSNYLDAMTNLLERASFEVDFIRRTEEKVRVSSPPLGVDACLQGSKHENYKDKLLILNPDVLLAEYRRSEHQLYTASSGFGCDPNSNGRTVYCKSLFDGHETSWNRQDFMGIADPGKLPSWAHEKLATNQSGNQLEDEDEMEL